MQANDTTPVKTGGFGTTVLLWLLGAALILAVFALAVDTLVPEIERDIKSRSTLALDGTGITEDNIDVTGLDVTLTGAINSEPLRDEAGKIVASVTGVHKVSNQLAFGSQSATNNSTETAATADSGSSNQPELDNADTSARDSAPLVIETANLEILAEDGIFVLRGELPDQNSVDRVSDALIGKFGPASVQNQINLAAGPAPLWLDGAIALIDQFDNIQQPTLAISNGEARLGGNVSSETLGEQKTAAARRLLGDDFTVQSALEVNGVGSSASARNSSSVTSAIKKRPGSLKLAVVQGRQTVTGVVSSAAELESIEDQASALYGSSVNLDVEIDETVEASGWAPQLFEAADELGAIDDLGLSVNSGQLILSGNLPDIESADRAKASVQAKMGDALNVIDLFNVTPQLADTATSPAAPTTSSEADLQIQTAAVEPAPTPEPLPQEPEASTGPVVTLVAIPTTEAAQRQQLSSRLADIDLSAVRFENGSTALTSDSLLALQRVAAIINDYDKPVVEISGHTDSTGDAFTNLELSKQRAEAVRQFLIEQRIPAGQVRAIGYGETKPVGDNGTPEGRAKNRRIEINL